jgi:hypothetical protein
MPPLSLVVPMALPMGIVEWTTAAGIHGFPAYGRLHHPAFVPERKLTAA